LSGGTAERRDLTDRRRVMDESSSTLTVNSGLSSDEVTWSLDPADVRRRDEL